MSAPSIEYAQLSPMIIVLGTAVVGVVVEAVAPRRLRLPIQLSLAFGALIAALVAVAVLAGYGGRGVAVAGSVAIDGPTLFLQGTLVAVAFVAMLFVAARTRARAPAAAFAAQGSTVPGSGDESDANEAGLVQSEVYPLTMFAVGGMMLFPAADDLLTMFVALEVLSLPLYVLCALARRRRLLSQEAALKYFLLGAFSSAFFLYGAAFLYGYSGTLSLPGIGAVTPRGDGSDAMGLVGAALLSVGLLFKVGAVPFHSWIPDVYQGAPTPITALMAAATKIAAFGALLRVYYVALPPLHEQWRPMLWTVAIATMVLGSLLALTQTDVKRMLAYSSVAHAGFLLTGVVAANQTGISSTLFYLVAYGFSTVGAFALMSTVREADDPAVEATGLSQWAGLGRRAPATATVFAIFLLSFAGIPLTSGFVGKFAVFQAAAAGGAAPLVIVGVVASAIAAYFYIRVIVVMFFAPPPEHAPVLADRSPLTALTVAISVVATVVLGIWPQPLLHLADQAAVFLR